MDIWDSFCDPTKMACLVEHVVIDGANKQIILKWPGAIAGPISSCENRSSCTSIVLPTGMDHLIPSILSRNDSDNILTTETFGDVCSGSRLISPHHNGRPGL
jgi:hypothetical protein